MIAVLLMLASTSAPEIAPVTSPAKDAYIACGCGCCAPESDATDKCLDRSKGETLEKIIAEDKALAANLGTCAVVGCSFPVRYHYCD